MSAKNHIDGTTQLIAPGHAVTGEIASIKTTNGGSKYHRILTEYPNLTQPLGAERKQIKHEVTHYIKTTPGPPVYSKPRRLTADRAKTVKLTFELTMQEGIIRPSKSP